MSMFLRRRDVVAGVTATVLTAGILMGATSCNPAASSTNCTGDQLVPVHSNVSHTIKMHLPAGYNTADALTDTQSLNPGVNLSVIREGIYIHIPTSC